MAIRTPGGPPPPGPQDQQREGLREKAAEDRQARASPKSQYQRPHRVHTSADSKVTFARKHQQELQEEARRHMIHDDASTRADDSEALEEQHRRVESLSDDDERKKRRQRENTPDETEQASPEETAAISLGLSEGGSGKYFQDMPADRLGDLTLTNPNEMKRVLGPSVRFAQHAMILADERMRGGTTREDALSYLASLYVSLTDRAYANKALREFGPATGIIDLYPLELVQHLLTHTPTFLSKVSHARFLSTRPMQGYESEVGKAIVLTYEPSLRIRGFAIKGGGKPGYVFEPVDPPGTYHLTFATPGRFVVLLSASTKEGVMGLEEFPVNVAPGTADSALAMEQLPAFQRTRSGVVDPDADPAAAQATGGATETPPPKKDPKDLKIIIPRRI